VTPDSWGALALQARVLAHGREHAVAQRLARKGVARCEQTDRLSHQGDVWWDLAEVLLAAGKTADAIHALEQAHERYERKRNLAMAAQMLPRLDSLRAASTTA
jgi:thioredoxin-like negative regulator of GroEL